MGPPHPPDPSWPYSTWPLEPPRRPVRVVEQGCPGGGARARGSQPSMGFPYLDFPRALLGEPATLEGANMSQIGYIIVNKQTLNPKTGTNHGAVLKMLGYNVELNRETEHFHIECEGFVEDSLIDLTNREEALVFVKGVVRSKKLLTYSSSFKVVRADGETTTLVGVHGARYLNQLFPGGSCLVAKKALTARKKVASTFSIDDILAD